MRRRLTRVFLISMLCVRFLGLDLAQIECRASGRAREHRANAWRSGSCRVGLGLLIAACGDPDHVDPVGADEALCGRQRHEHRRTQAVDARAVRSGDTSHAEIVRAPTDDEANAIAWPGQDGIRH